MTNVLGLPLETALAILGRSDIVCEELHGRLPRTSTNEDSIAPRENAPRGTLRVVRQTESKLTVCRFNDTVKDSTEEPDEDIR